MHACNSKEKADDLHSIVMLLKVIVHVTHTCMCTYTADKLVRQGAIPVVLTSMVSSARRVWCSDDLLLLYHSLLLHLASKGEYFTVVAK